MVDSTNPTFKENLAEFNDEELIAYFRKGLINREDFLANLLSRYIKYLFMLGKKQRLADDEIEDLIQRTIIVVLQKIDDFDIATNFRLWLRFNFNKILKKYKKKKRSESEAFSEIDYSAEGLDSIADKSANTELLAIDNEKHALIAEAIERGLTPNQQELVLLFYQGMSYQEIAKTTNQSEISVRTNLHRATKKLAKYLGDKGVFKE